MENPKERPLSVSALSQKISAQLSDIGTVLVQGELSQAKIHTSGHFYATLKDSESVVSLVMWRSTVVRNGPMPREGSLVLVRGSVTVYPPRGQYQITASRIAPLGAGDLAAHFAELKARLEAEGLFDQERKLPLPALPRAVGLATAAGSAALADMLHSLRARFPSMSIVHAPCQVQGAEAAASIVRAIRALDRRDDVEVIIVGRGGGSLEDLWAFNEESVVRAIAACITPIVAAVGHETDTTLADFAADLRAKTPTAAAELVVPVEAELRERILSARIDLNRAIERLIDEARQRLAALATHRALAGPGYQIALRRQRLDEVAMDLDVVALARIERLRQDLREGRLRLVAADPRRRLHALSVGLEGMAKALGRAAFASLSRRGDRLGSISGRLEALSPLAVIARGYSIVRLADGTLVRRLSQAPPGTAIEARIEDGWIEARVETGRKQRLNEAGEHYEG